jgi:hypothetical protein
MNIGGGGGGGVVAWYFDQVLATILTNFLNVWLHQIYDGKTECLWGVSYNLQGEKFARVKIVDNVNHLKNQQVTKYFPFWPTFWTYCCPLSGDVAESVGPTY